MSKLEKNDEQKNNSDTKSSIANSSTIIPAIQNVFHFWNEDEYTGDFIVVKDKIMMNEKGVYKTSDGHIYEGIWDNDYLIHANKIVFPDSSMFLGTLDQMMIQGRGKYFFPGDFEIEGYFIDNELVREVHLTDPNQKMWKGEVEEDCVVNFNPLHSFWQYVLSLPPKFPPFDTFLHAGEAEEDGF